MIVDKVETGFRVAAGGAQELLGVQGDLVTYAKAMGTVVSRGSCAHRSPKKTSKIH
jgi:glutamate-1-semialdehyde 2,1-aminomutase